MRVIIAGGGTAGHINPALAIASYIKTHDKNAKILYVGAKNSMEQKLVPKAGFDFCSIRISGFQRGLSFRALRGNFATLNRIVMALFESKRIIKSFKPTVCIGTGGYVSGPILRTAAKLGTKIVIHEQNAFPGITTKMLAKISSCVMLGNAAARKYLPNTKIKVVGNPIKKELLNLKKQEVRKKLKFDSRPVILSFGGSLGSDRINLAIADLISNTIKNRDMYYHIHAYGRANKNFMDILKQKNINLETHKNIDVREYIENMPEVLVASDLVICRAGAITLAEITATGKASVLIPSPNVSENHQYYNAMELVKTNAAVLLEEKDLSSSSLKLLQIVNKIVSSKKILEVLSKNSKKIFTTNADEKIFNIIKSL
ncbi:MAG: undecaprenyldiphospho-muramoylpentapeptide beta-N-acetylglucosaminyltransferase [Oscillospiraceae bacterium]|nr:undecaprenyldiphospho-muramoylpentapeptide beta-N-acetylglucosaminyltransferase [Oscillospiraceae bacterium]